MKEKIEAKIALIEKERAAYLDGANKQLAAFEGALQVLRKMLEEETAPAPEPPADPAAADIAFAAHAMNEAAKAS